MLKLIAIRVFYSIIVLMMCHGCGSTQSHNLINHKWVNNKNKKQIKKVLILPSEIKIVEIYPGNIVEQSYSWSMVASTELDKELLNRFQKAERIDAVDASILSEFNNIDSQIKFTKYVANTIPMYTNGWNKWPHKLKYFDYSVGSGFKPLSEKGIDAIILVTGAQANQRYRFDGASTETILYPKEKIRFGNLFLTVSLIDVESGDIMWNNYHEYYQIDLRYPEDIGYVFNQFMANFPQHLLPAL